MSKSKLARDAVERIIKDLQDRKGFGYRWAEIDPETRQEIKTTWMRIVLGALSENPDLDYQSDAPWILEGGEPSVLPKRAAQVLVMHPVREKFILVVEEEGGDILLPGGHIEPSEAIWKGTQRELKEETDLHVYDEDLTPIAYGKGIAEPDCHMFIFLARKVFGQEKPVERGTKLHWADWKMLLERSSFRSFYEKNFPKGFSHLKPTVWREE